MVPSHTSLQAQAQEPGPDVSCCSERDISPPGPVWSVSCQSRMWQPWKASTSFSTHTPVCFLGCKSHHLRINAGPSTSRDLQPHLVLFLKWRKVFFSQGKTFSASRGRVCSMRPCRNKRFGFFCFQLPADQLTKARKFSINSISGLAWLFRFMNKLVLGEYRRDL